MRPGATISQFLFCPLLLSAMAACQTNKGENKEETSSTTGVSSACELEVVAKSEHAAGNPCLTTEEYMRQLGLSVEEQQRVEAIYAYLGKREEKMGH